MRPQQLCAVGDRRFEDAQFLYRHDGAARWNAAVYLAGIAIECYLKAALFKRHHWLASATWQRVRDEGDPEKMEVYDLFYRSHDLRAMLAGVPDLQRQMEREGPLKSFAIVAGWSIYARYATRQITKGATDEFMKHVREVRLWLRPKVT